MPYHAPMFSVATATWFRESFPFPTEVQRRGWAAIDEDKHSLLVAPTGSGKTLAAFLAGIDACLQLPPDAPEGVRVLYVSPLKALVYDVERNLRVPLSGIRKMAGRMGLNLREVRVDVRTGDTPQAHRRSQARHPADILATTPESLFLLLSSRARDALRTVHTVIVDEVHALAPEKRGTHLALSLEWLADVSAIDPRRIGLSATVRPLEDIAAWLGGGRPVEVVDASAPPALDLQIVVPVADMERPPLPSAGASSEPAGETVTARPRQWQTRTPPGERGMWPSLYPALLAEIRAARTAIVFVNSRGLAEKLAHQLNELAGETLVHAHHGSLSHEQRREMENDLKAGRIRGMVATSSLELGIDMDTVDRVLMVESPGAVARGLQRAGRAGHAVGEVSRARIYPKFRGDLLECAVVAGRMLKGEIEALRLPANALDVLAQQVTAWVDASPMRSEEILDRAGRAQPYRGLTRALLDSVLDMLSGRYPGGDFAELRPLLAWDRAQDLLTPRRGAGLTVRMNAGVIPDRGLYAAYLGEGGPRLGELDEEMVYETRKGDVIQLGASTWRVEAITRDRVLVSPAPGEAGRLPFWKGDGPGRPVELGKALGAFVREAAAQPAGELIAWLMAHAPLDRLAAENLARYLTDQAEESVLPTDRQIVVERFRDELGDWRVCLLSPFGARVHAPWAIALQQSLAARAGIEVQMTYSDDGIVLRFADVEQPPDSGVLFPEPEEVEAMATAQLAHTPLFAGLFRENAARALLMPKRNARGRRPLWAQRIKAQQLLATVSRHPDFPIVLETYRQALSDVFDLPGLQALLAAIRARKVRVREVETSLASPFARSLVFAYVAANLYEGDAPAAERRAQALTLDRRMLAELLGQAELADLLDIEAIQEVEADLQRLDPRHSARDADDLHDLLRTLGDLTEAEIQARCPSEWADWLTRLKAARRAIVVRIADEARWIAAEDAGLYRDALRVHLPRHLPNDCTAPVADALPRLAWRYARRHGPFVDTDFVQRYGLTPAEAEPVLERLLREGQLLRGQIVPGRTDLQWVDAEVLKRIKRLTLARLRHQTAAREPAALGRFLPAWQGLASAQVPGGKGWVFPPPEQLLEALRPLEALALPWSTLVSTLLPMRLPGFASEQLDWLATSGALVWVGVAALGPRDGKVMLLRRERVPLLLTPGDGGPFSPLHAALLDHLRARGASFLTELEHSAQQAVPHTTARAFEAALWDLVWAGRITNDSFAPLRALLRGPKSGERRHASQTLAGGRWSLVSDLLPQVINPPEQALAWSEVLLERYGIVSREAVAGEAVPGGWGLVRQALKAMEEAGRLRRGYFVEGLAGVQYALPGAVERLRDAAREEGRDTRILAALDPANPYGALLPWPEAPDLEARPRRIAGAWVVLVQGHLVLFLSPGGRNLLTFLHDLPDPREFLAAALRALARVPAGGRRHFTVQHVDGREIWDSPWHGLMLENGFAPDYGGLRPQGLL